MKNQESVCHQLKKELFESERRRSVDTRVGILAREQLSKVRTELRNTQNELLNLQVQVAQMSRKEKNSTKQMKAMAKSWEAAFQKRRSKRQKKMMRKEALLAERRQERRLQALAKDDKQRNKSNDVDNVTGKTFSLPKISAPDFDIESELANLGGSKKYKRVVLRLNQVMSLAAERLQNIVEIRHELRHVVEERDSLSKQFQDLKAANREMKANDEDSRVQYVKLMNRLVRAEALAASMEKQLRITINVAKSKDIYANKRDSVTAALDAMRVDYSYKPDIEVSERIREALAQPLILSADEIIDSEDLNEESLSRAIQGKGNKGPESSPDGRDNANANTFDLRETRNNMLMAIGPKPTAKHSLANFPKRKGRVYKEIGGSS